MHARSPTQQGAGRRHLRTCTEKGDIHVSKVQPIGVIEHQVQRLAEGRFGDPRAYPMIDLSAQVIAEEPPPLVRDR
jgi:hypothetical protein